MFVYVHRVRAGTALHSLQSRAWHTLPRSQVLNRASKFWSEIDSKKIVFWSKIGLGIQEGRCTPIVLEVPSGVCTQYCLINYYSRPCIISNSVVCSEVCFKQRLKAVTSR